MRIKGKCKCNNAQCEYTSVIVKTTDYIDEEPLCLMGFGHLTNWIKHYD